MTDIEMATDYSNILLTINPIDIGGDGGDGGVGNVGNVGNVGGVDNVVNVGGVVAGIDLGDDGGDEGIDGGDLALGSEPSDTESQTSTKKIHYKKLSFNDVLTKINEHYEQDTVHRYSSAMDILASYLKKLFIWSPELIQFIY